MTVRRRLDGVYVVAWAACAWSVACGGADTANPNGASPSVDAAASDVVANRGTPAGQDASTSDASLPATTDCGDVAAGGVCDGESPADAAGSAADAADAPAASLTPTDGVVCQVEWPQVYGLFAGPSDMHVAIDSAANAFVALSYGNDADANDSAPPLDLGVSSPRYPEGFVVAKIDPQCHLLWMREFGMMHVGASTVGTKGVAVDANSNVTVLGSFFGSVDLGAGTVDAGPVITDDAGDGYATYATFLLRLDANGNLVFSKVFPASDGWLLGVSLAVTPDGVSTVVAAGSSGADFGSGPVTGADPGALDNRYLAQFGATGSVSLAEAFPGDGPNYQQLLADPNGGLWALDDGDSDAGSTQSMTRLNSTGGFVWSRALAPGPATGFAVNATGEVAFGASPFASPPLSETVTAYSSDGASTSSHVTTVAYLGPQVSEQVVLDATGDAIVAGNFEGSLITAADGSFTQTQTPSGAGYQRFDSAGVLRSVTVWGGASAELGSIGLAPNGNVVMVGLIEQPTISDPPPTLFLVKFAP